MEIDKRFARDFTSFEQMENSTTVRGMHDWAVPWSDLMMVVFVLFVVLFIYAGSHKDVKILFSDQSAAEARASSALDPLIGLIGQIASQADGGGSRDSVRMPESQALYRDRGNGISIIREAPGRVRITLRGKLFFDAMAGKLNPGAEQYLDEIAKVVQLNVGGIHVIGYTDLSEAAGSKSFSLSTQRAAGVAEHFIRHFHVDPKRISVTGRGAYRPEQPETTENNQEMNRRVEIVIVNES